MKSNGTIGWNQSVMNQPPPLIHWARYHYEFNYQIEDKAN